MSSTVYFQGFGLALTHDYSGGFMVRDEDRNGIGDPAQLSYSVVVREGFNCPHEEFIKFLAHEESQ